MLSIDIGNSRIKCALFKGADIHRACAAQYSDANFEEVLAETCMPLESSLIMISHVAGKNLKSRLINWLEGVSSAKIVFAKSQAKQCNIINSYAVPANMGVDRWLAMIAAYNPKQESSQQSICVIDCGTAITLDVLNPQGLHLGGLIMPGYRTMLESLESRTANITMPGSEATEKAAALANGTHSAIQLGCQQLIIGGLGDIVKNLESSLEGRVSCVISGGHGYWVSTALSCENIYRPLLVLEGLRLVAEQLEQKG